MTTGKKIVFFSLAAYGHLNPTLGILKKLVERGYEVITYNTREFKEKILETGAQWRPHPFPSRPIDWKSSQNVREMAKISLEISEDIIPTLLKHAEKDKPDLIIHDSMCLWAKIIAGHMEIPAVSLFTTLVLKRRVIFSFLPVVFQEITDLLTTPRIFASLVLRYRKLYKKYQLRPPSFFDIASNEERLNIVFTSALFQPFAHTFKSTYRFVGPSILARNEKRIDLSSTQNKKLIYISLGTINNDDLEFYKTYIEAFVNQPYDVYITVGKNVKPSDFPSVPANIHIAPIYPQLQILEKTAVFITHAGMNSVNEGLFFGVPMLLFPKLPEQKINARRVEQLRAGIYVRRKKMGPKVLLGQVERILHNPHYKKAATTIHNSLVGSGGSDEAVHQILSFFSKSA